MTWMFKFFINGCLKGLVAAKLVCYVLIIKKVVLALSSQVAAGVHYFYSLHVYRKDHWEDKHHDYILCLIVFYTLFLSLLSTGFQRTVLLLGIFLGWMNYLTESCMEK